MRTRLKRELHEFLLQDGISLETHLFNDFIYRMAGIEVAEKEVRKGFDLTTSSWDKNEELSFTLPHIKMPQVITLLEFLNVKLSDCEANSPVTLNEKFVFEHLLPNFKNYYAHIKANNPDLIAKYIVASKPILESSAVNTLIEYTRNGLDLLIDDEASYENTAIGKKVIDSLMLLSTNVSHLSKWPSLYKSVIAEAGTFQELLQHPEVAQSKELSKHLRLVLEGIELFKRYNRNESVLANKFFMKEMEAFLNQDKLKISASQCDIIERILLNLANATLGIKGKARMDIGYDASRMVFGFEDIDSQNTQKLIKFFHSLGDETAIEGSGYRQHGGAIPESASLKSMAIMDMPRPRPEKIYVESHSVEVDGKFLYEKLLPKLKAEVLALESKDPATLNKYREESRAYFKEKASVEKPTNNVYVLFQPKSVQQAAPDQPKVQDKPSSYVPSCYRS